MLSLLDVISQKGSYTITIHRISHDIMEKHKFNKHETCYWLSELEIAGIVWAMIEEQYKLDHHFIFIYRYNKRRRKKAKLQQ